MMRAPGNARPSSSAVRPEPLPTVRQRSPSHREHRHSTASAPHHWQAGVAPCRFCAIGPWQAVQRAVSPQSVQARRGA